MKVLKISLKIILFCLFLGILTKSWHLITDGFRLDKIKSEDVFEDFNISQNDPSKYEQIFNQKFSYLSKGCQTYVFESEDKNYVLKFVRYKRYKPPFWLRFSLFNKKNQIRKFYKSKLLKNSLYSYKASINELKNETQVLYVHLNKTNNLKKVLIQDRLKKTYFIDLNEYGFILQKKAIPFEKILLSNINDEIMLQKLIKSFYETTVSIYKKGYNNDDYNCIKNSGYIDGKVIHMDIGSFLKKQNLKSSKEFEKELLTFSKYFKKWANKHASFMLPYIDQEIRNVVSNNCKELKDEDV
ncbi:MAG: hypothetical protein JXA94_06870 [Parachlamydiales bacterium]|nr:hypothetical protein [Parachlamydiales bacterium]